MPDTSFEEEEYTSQITMPVVRRILGLLRPYWPQTLAFLVAIGLTSWMDSYFTYINKGIIDQGIVRHDIHALYRLAVRYGIVQVAQPAR